MSTRHTEVFYYFNVPTAAEDFKFILYYIDTDITNLNDLGRSY